MVNESDILKFYDFIGHKSETEIRMINPKTKNVMSFFVHNAKEFLEVCTKYDGKYNIYAGINERTHGGKEDDDVLSITNIGHDVDCHGDIGKLPLAKQIIDEYVLASKATDLQDPLIFCSGRGFWILHHISPIEPIENNKTKIKLWANKIKKLFEQPGVEFDSTVYNFSRIARVPGTLNISDPNNHVQSYIVNNPNNISDKVFTQKILEIEMPVYKDIETKELPVGGCDFMNYCLNNNLPTGEIHHTIARNFSVYIHDNPNREQLRTAFNKRYDGANLDCWLQSMDSNPNKKYPFSCGQLISYQYKNNIPLQCLKCKLYRNTQEESEPKGWACSVNIRKFAEKHNFTKCNVCKNDLSFNEKLGFYSCDTCKYQGGLKMFTKLMLKNKMDGEI